MADGNMRCDECVGHIIPGQGKWVPPGPSGRRMHKSPTTERQAMEEHLEGAIGSQRTDKCSLRGGPEERRRKELTGPND